MSSCRCGNLIAPQIIESQSGTAMDLRSRYTCPPRNQVCDDGIPQRFGANRQKLLQGLHFRKRRISNGTDNCNPAGCACSSRPFHTSTMHLRPKHCAPLHLQESWLYVLRPTRPAKPLTCCQFKFRCNSQCLQTKKECRPSHRCFFSFTSFKTNIAKRLEKQLQRNEAAPLNPL